MVRILSADRRETILNTALKLFVAKGVNNTSTAEIAKAAGIATGTLFLYFATKQELLDELILRIGRDLANSINQQLDPAFSARETFWQIWNSSLQCFLKDMDTYLYVQQVRDTGLISAAAGLESNKFFTFYYAAIQKGFEEKSIKPYPTDLIGGFLYQGIVAVMNHIRMQPDRENVDEIIRQGFEIFWDGIKTVRFEKGGNEI
jgi:AcrR family transcriptional regulator